MLNKSNLTVLICVISVFLITGSFLLYLSSGDKEKQPVVLAGQDRNTVFGSVDDKKKTSVKPETSTPAPTGEDDSEPATASEVIKTTEVEENDLIIFLIDVSSSMEDDVDDIRNNIKEIITRYDDKSFMVISYTYSPELIGEASKSRISLELSLQNCAELIKKNSNTANQLTGTENSLQALEFSIQNSTGFKSPIIFLVTDAAPNDKNTIDPDSVIKKLNSANASLYVLEVNDTDGGEAKNGGAAIGDETYSYIVSKMKRKSDIKFLK